MRQAANSSDFILDLLDERFPIGGAPLGSQDSNAPDVLADQTPVDTSSNDAVEHAKMLDAPVQTNASQDASSWDDTAPGQADHGALSTAAPAIDSATTDLDGHLITNDGDFQFNDTSGYGPSLTNDEDVYKRQGECHARPA